MNEISRHSVNNIEYNIENGDPIPDSLIEFFRYNIIPMANGETGAPPSLIVTRFEMDAIQPILSSVGYRMLVRTSDVYPGQYRITSVEPIVGEDGSVTLGPATTKQRPPLWVYLSGPYTGDVVGNVRAACEHWEDLIQNYHCVPICPHWSHIQALLCCGEMHYEGWIDYDLDILTVLSKSPGVVFRFGGESDGADREVEHAKELGITVVDSWTALTDYLNAYEKQGD